MSARRTLAPPAEVAAEQPRYLLTGDLELITPVFGGGVRVRSHEDERQIKDRDPITPIRSASVRGQLREWWRRTCGFDENGPLPPSELRAREHALWGWATTEDDPGRGWVSVEVDAGGLGPAEDEPVFTKRKRDDGREAWVPKLGALQYATFPLMPPNGNGQLNAGTLWRADGTFTVRLRTSGSLRGTALTEARAWSQVRRAFESWATFGGYGARTRRGFGALSLRGGPAPHQLIHQLRWAHRAAWGPSYDLAPGAQEYALERLKSFRQGEGVGRNEGRGSRPGRSRWPEPDQLRRLHGKPTAHRPVHPVPAFPRAAFGMPIIFHFQQREVPDSTLTPVGRGRLASPLVLRPVKFGEHDYRPLLLRLPELEPLSEVLDRVTLTGIAGESRGLLTEAEQALVSPLADQSRPGDGVDAVFEPFFRYFSEGK